MYLFINYTCTLLFQYIMHIIKHMLRPLCVKWGGWMVSKVPLALKFWCCASVGLCFLICTMCLYLHALINYAFNKHLKHCTHGALSCVLRCSKHCHRHGTTFRSSNVSPEKSEELTLLFSNTGNSICFRLLGMKWFDEGKVLQFMHSTNACSVPHYVSEKRQTPMSTEKQSLPSWCFQFIGTGTL